MIVPVRDVKEFITRYHECGKCGRTMHYVGCEPFYGPPNHPAIKCPACERTYHVMTARDARSYGMTEEQIAERLE